MVYLCVCPAWKWGEDERRTKSKMVFFPFESKCFKDYINLKLPESEVITGCSIWSLSPKATSRTLQSQKRNNFSISCSSLSFPAWTQLISSPLGRSPWKCHKFLQWMQYPASAGDVRDRGLIPRSGSFLEEEGMATHSSSLAWRIPWTEEPGGLLSEVLQRVGLDWSNLAYMLACCTWGQLPQTVSVLRLGAGSSSGLLSWATLEGPHSPEPGKSA